MMDRFEDAMDTTVVGTTVEEPVVDMMSITVQEYEARVQRARDEARSLAIRQANDSTRRGIIEYADDNSWDRDSLNDLLDALGMEKRTRDWDVTIEHEGGTLEFALEDTEMEYEHEVIDYVIMNLDVTVQVEITFNGSDGYESDDFEADNQWVFDNLDITATER